jgi:amino acid transporter
MAPCHCVLYPLAKANGSHSKFNYLLKKPTFLATCLFGITFIVLENTAANSVSLAQNLLDAAHTQQTPGRIIAISLAANTLACLLHTISRKWGIILNNILGTVKFLILIFIFIIGLVWIDRGVVHDNLSIKTSFNTRNSPRLPYRYAEAMVYVIYPYGAFHQINYVCTLVLAACLYNFY